MPDGLSQTAASAGIGQSIANVSTTKRERVVAWSFVAAVVLLTACALPFAKVRLPDYPGLIAVYQTALVVAYALGAVILFGHFFQSRLLPIWIVGSGSLFTLLMTAFQLLSFRNIFSAGPTFGAGSDTTIWLWTMWHLGPPVFALIYALVPARQEPLTVEATWRWGIGGTLAVLGLSALALAVCSPWVSSLPKLVEGDDYSRLVTSGVGIGVQVVTVVALGLVVFKSRPNPTMLELWIACSLALLVADNVITFVGATRGSVGWLVGRLVALTSAWVIIAAYLRQLDALRRQAAQAEALIRDAQHMETLGRVAGGVAHDMNNLLTVVVGALESIRRKPEPRRVEEMAGHALTAVDRGSKLISQLLTYARRQSHQKTVVDANLLLREFEPLLRQGAGQLVELEFALGPALPSTLLDRTQFESAIMNVVINARDAMPGGGIIRIATRSLSIDEAAPDMKAGAYVCVEVRDGGTGMDEATLRRAIEPFFTTKAAGVGTGLGLSQAYGFAKSVGGDLRLVSSPGRGTTVSFLFPADVLPAVAEPAAAQASTLSRPKAQTVLLVDDNIDVLQTTQSMLEDLGYSVVPASGGEEALRVLQSSQSITALCTDVVMPRMNGVELATKARVLRPTLPVLLVSGFADAALATSSFPLLGKPFTRKTLQRRLAEILEDGLAKRTAQAAE